MPKGIIYPVSDVHEPLVSIGPMADAGFECLLSKTGGFMRDTDSEEMILLSRRGKIYHMPGYQLQIVRLLVESQNDRIRPPQQKWKPTCPNTLSFALGACIATQEKDWQRSEDRFRERQLN